MEFCDICGFEFTKKGFRYIKYPNKDGRLWCKNCYDNVRIKEYRIAKFVLDR